MHILYVASICSEAAYQRLFANVKDKPAFQSQKYHRLFAEGLAANAEVDVIANPPGNRNTMEQEKVILPDEAAAGVRYHNINAYRHPVRKLLHVTFGTFRRVVSLARKDSVVIVDCLNRTAALSALLAAKLRGIKSVCIITDLPDMLGGSPLAVKLANWAIRFSDSYVVLTKAMNDYVNKKGKPYVVLEGHADISMAEKIPALERKLPRRVCLYAGGISKQYGLEELVEGFRLANIPNAQLHIYGCGDYVPELEAIAREDDRIVYGGMLFAHQVVEKEMEATLLVNPRPTVEEFVKYSFPSKTMEYMSTGTPVLTTVLPGLPKEYYPHVYLIHEESRQGIAKALQDTLANSDEELFAKGCAAREFVLNQRNNVIQASRVLDMIRENFR